MYSARKFLFAVVCLCFCLITKAQKNSFKLIPPQYELEYLKLNNKEDIGVFTDVNQDKDGYLWFSSSKGLHVFDGNSTVTYQNGKAQYLLAPDSTNQPFNILAKNDRNEFWTLEDTLHCFLFDPQQRKIVTTISKKPGTNLMMYSGETDKYGNLYTCYIDRLTGKVYIYKVISEDSLLLVYQAKDPAKNNFSNFYYRIVGNDHWLVIPDKLIKISLDGKTSEIFDLPANFFNQCRLFTDQLNFYFISPALNAIYYWDSVTDKIEKFVSLPDMVKNKGHAFFVKGNTVYIGSNLNLYIIDRINNTVQDLSPQFTELAKKEVPNSLAIPFLKFFQCTDSSLLACTQTDLFRLKKKILPDAYYNQRVEKETKISTLTSFRGITEDESGNVYVSYYTGISVKDKKSDYFKPLATGKYINSELFSTYSINYWNGNLLWNNTIINIATGKQTYLARNNFSGHCTQYLHNDTLWFIIWYSNELNCYDLKNKKLATFQLDKKMTNGKAFLEGISDITGDASGQNLWISSNHEGISLVSKKGALVKQYNAAALLSGDNDVNELELCGDTLWYGCSNGLGELNTVTGEIHLYRDPELSSNLSLQNRIVFSILKDSLQNFYLGSNYGLLYFDTHTKKFFDLPKDHPLSKIEFNRVSDFQSSDHRYYFGTTNGLYSFMPGELEFEKPSGTVKPIKLISVSIFNTQKNNYRYLSKDLDSTKKIFFDPFDNNIEFNFSVPEFYNTVYYSYRIKGQSSNWTEYKADNKVLLYDLPPGSYVLEVKASTSVTDENASYYELLLEKEQVWYKKEWVIILFSILLVSGIVLFVRNNFKQKLKRQQELEVLRTKISSDLHDDVGTILSGLAMQSQMLAYTANDTDKEQLNEISGMSREAMERMRDTVWAMDSRKDKYENLIDRMRSFAEKNLSMKKITHEFILDKIDTKKFISPEKRQAIYLIFKEAITNIIKHSDGTHVAIKFAQEKNRIILLVHDNGNKKNDTHSDGLGISNMKMRAEKVGGNLTTQNENGYTVELVINN